MPQTYYPPKHGEHSFNCPHCHVYAMQLWLDCGALITQKGIQEILFQVPFFEFSKCNKCGQLGVWHRQQLIMPFAGSHPPHEELPADLLPDYQEAVEIAGRSPRGAAALLRLVLQKLLKELGGKGKDINDDIHALLKGGMSEEIQQACDVVRVVGNNAVHPGKIDLSDTPAIVTTLFELINHIVEVQIAQPKRIRGAFSSLPQGALQAIAARNAKR